MPEQIHKKISNDNFFLIAFICGFVLFLVLQVIFLLLAAIAVELRQPGFFSSFYENYFVNNTLELTPVVVGILNVSQMIAELLIAGIFIVILRKELAKDWKDAISSNNIGHNLAIIGGGFVAILVATYGLSYIYDALSIEGTSENQAMIEAFLSFDSKIFMIITTVLLAPFVEEILFRKLLFGVLEDKMHLKPLLAVLISALLFAAIHGVDIFFFQYFALALIISASYALSNNNIFVSIGLHFINNSFSIVMYFLYEALT
jgi:hypothetical protein